MKSLFDRTRLASLPVKNRLVRSATRDGLADDRGHLTEELLERYVELARGGVGTIITGHAYVTGKEQSRQPGQMGIYDDACGEGYRRLTAAVHEHDCRIILQLSCIGAQTFSSGAGKLIWGPSPVADLATGIVPTKMSVQDIRYLQQAFAAAARRAQAAGFDGVQIHAAHGYLLNKFLNPYYNRRPDDYGGPFANRARMILETYAAMRQEVGPAYPILIKVNSEDFLEGGMPFEECRRLCRLLEADGIDAIEISGGSLSSPTNLGPIRTDVAARPSYFRAYAAKIAEQAKVPVLLVGGHRDPRAMTDILNSSRIDFLSLCRPLIREPDLVGRWRRGELAPSRCISCNGCLGLAQTHCVLRTGAGVRPRG